jgi:hypothetical protein
MGDGLQRQYGVLTMPANRSKSSHELEKMIVSVGCWWRLLRILGPRTSQGLQTASQRVGCTAEACVPCEKLSFSHLS